MKKFFDYIFLFLLIMIAFLGCTEKRSKAERSHMFTIFPLSPYGWKRDGNCVKYFIIRKENEDSLTLIKKLIAFIDTSISTKNFSMSCEQAHFVFYKTSPDLDTSFRETKQTSLSLHTEDLLGMGEYVRGRIFSFEFNTKEKTTFFYYDSVGKVKRVLEFKR